VQVKLGALAGIKKKKAQASKNRDRFVSSPFDDIVLSPSEKVSHFCRRDKKLAAASKKKQKASKK
jgi:hypothetical protein